MIEKADESLIKANKAKRSSCSTLADRRHCEQNQGEKPNCHVSFFSVSDAASQASGWVTLKCAHVLPAPVSVRFLH